MKGIFFLLPLSLLFSCSSSQVTDMQQTEDETVDQVSGSQRDITSLIKQITISNLNQFIERENGLWLIQSSGAMPTMTNYTEVDKNFPLDFTSCEESKLPKIDCGAKNFWTKEGCFIQQENTFAEEKIWMYSGLNAEDEAKVAELAKTISYTVVNTSLNARYYFSWKEGQCRLVFADLRRPCNA